MILARTEARSEASPQRTAKPESLALLRDLFARLHAASVRYCHWKSNEHLAASMRGVTDLDVLVDRADAAPLARVLAELNFKRFQVQPGLGYPGVEDYVGFDVDSGALVHFHLHYQLTLGEKFLKGYRLPWEKLVLATRIVDPHFGIYIAEPNLELLLLMVRATLKIRLRDMVVALHRPFFSGAWLRERGWLVARMEVRQLHQLAESLLGPTAASRLVALVQEPTPTLRALRAFRMSIVPSISEYRLYEPLDALWRRWAREAIWTGRSLRQKYLGGPPRSTRRSPHGGLVIAIVGPDGAGKTTVAATITKWLSREAAVLPLYGGSGTGPISLPRRVLEWLAGASRGKRTAATAPGRASPLRRLGRALWALALARERAQWARRVRRARGLSIIVLSDRFPQSQFPGLNDGPHLAHWHDDRSVLCRAAARLEAATFRAVERCPPDLVIRLRVSAHVALQRKPATPVVQLRRKIELATQIAYPADTHVVDIGAESALEHVLLDVKRAVWGHV